MALKHLQKLGVEVKLGVMVLGKSDRGKRDSLQLNNGTVLETDLYIPAIGVIPNNSFIPSALLDASGYLVTTPEQKVSSLEVQGVYGVGDITTNPSKMAVTVLQQIAVTVANLKVDIEKTGKRKAFKAEKITMVVPIGGKGGVAQMGDLGGLVLWSWVVWLVKGNYLIPVAFMISGLKKQ